MYKTIKGLRIQICIDYNDLDYQWYRPYIDHNADGWLLMGHSKGNGQTLYSIVTAIHVPIHADSYLLVKDCACCLIDASIYNISHEEVNIDTILEQTRTLPDLADGTVDKNYNRVQITPTCAEYLHIYHTHIDAPVHNYFEYIYYNRKKHEHRFSPFIRTDYLWWPAHFSVCKELDVGSLRTEITFITYKDVTAALLGIIEPLELFC